MATSPSSTSWTQRFPARQRLRRLLVISVASLFLCTHVFIFLSRASITRQGHSGIQRQPQQHPSSTDQGRHSVCGEDPASQWHAFQARSVPKRTVGDIKRCQRRHICQGSTAASQPTRHPRRSRKVEAHGRHVQSRSQRARQRFGQWILGQPCPRCRYSAGKTARHEQHVDALNFRQASTAKGRRVTLLIAAFKVVTRPSPSTTKIVTSPTKIVVATRRSQALSER